MQKKAILAAGLFAAATLAQAADIAAGKAKVAQVCAACHGADGVSVADTIPNLGGQRAAYLEAQLRALRDGSRKNALMNPIARQLSAEDIANIAAYFASVSGAGSATRSDFMPTIARTRVTLPADHRATFTRYHAANFPEAKVLKVYYANPAALRAAKNGTPLPAGSMVLSEVYSVRLDDKLELAKDAAGIYLPNQLLYYSTMERGDGWGADLPLILRNEDWNYAAFLPDRKPRPGINHAECLACHKSQDQVSFLFTLKELTDAAKK